ncbi:MAG: electron transport complex subunit RsxC [Gammaproteobacteria bacterium]|nr:electron transport complex subunit RsxC [Gammaproteobacteria bacterium]MBT8133818.1 electron transport complex subunit RsxC [Gammaproteobacteria bacterium]NNJ49625.1 electron transport complex subunit RsxC [Gammaproteobacteria bacterium]
MSQIEILSTDNKLTTIDGGLRLVGHKHISTVSKITTVAPCKTYIVPLQQHIGAISQPLVKTGDRVLKGQMLAMPGDLVSAAVHSPVSGTVSEIRQHDIPHISGLSDLCVVIDNDFKDEWIERNPIAEDYNNTTSSELRKIVRDAGIVGLGGATFPSSVKQTEMNIKTLILNGVECEPYITCDDALMREHAREIISGADIIGHIIKARQCIIAIEDNKPEAIQALQSVVDEDGTGYFIIQVVPTIYPSGGEKQLIQILTGEEVPKGRFPAELGVLCHNVATAYAIHRAVFLGEPLISRIVTITGHGVSHPQNIEALIGTPMKKCIEHCGGYTEDSDELIMGGPMMGFSLQTDELPVVKATNCLLVTARQEDTHRQRHLPCIRCGKCADVCPVRLLPQQLYWYASSQNNDRLVEHNLFDCIECGCCAYVCPSDIPLVQYYRHAKTTIWQQERERKSSDISRQRHEAHQRRLDKIKQEREEKMRKKRELLKKKSQEQASKNQGDEKSSKQAIIAEAIARAQAKKAQRNKDQGNAGKQSSDKDSTGQEDKSKEISQN